MDFMKLGKYKEGKDYSGWIVQRKLDGVFAALNIKDGVLYSRTQRPLYIPKDSELEDNLAVLATAYDSDKVDFLLFELCAPNISLEQLSGLVSPNRKEPWSEEELKIKFNFGIHDAIKLNNGEDAKPYEERYKLALDGTSLYPGVYNAFSEKLEKDFEERLEGIFEYEVKIGSEGIVLKDPAAPYRMGKRTNSQLKRVREHLEDVKIEEVKYGNGKRAGQLGSFYCRSVDNPEVTFWADLGKSWDDEKRIQLTKDFESGSKDLIGSIWTVRGLQPSSTGKSIRLPKLMYERFDKE